MRIGMRTVLLDPLTPYMRTPRADANAALGSFLDI